MNHSELEALRRLLFFSAPEAAAMIGGVSEQAWRRWESSARGVPDDVMDKIIWLADWRLQSIDAAVNQITNCPEDALISLVWYESVDDWLTIAGRGPVLWRPQQSSCAAVYAEFSSRTRLVPFDPVSYASWLGGRVDTETARAEWAGYYPFKPLPKIKKWGPLKKF